MLVHVYRHTSMAPFAIHAVEPSRLGLLAKLRTSAGRAIGAEVLVDVSEVAFQWSLAGGGANQAMAENWGCIRAFSWDPSCREPQHDYRTCGSDCGWSWAGHSGHGGYAMARQIPAATAHVSETCLAAVPASTRWSSSAMFIRVDHAPGGARRMPADAFWSVWVGPLLLLWSCRLVVTRFSSCDLGRSKGKRFSLRCPHITRAPQVPRAGVPLTTSKSYRF